MTAAYVPGVCNIGPEEIARRRRSGHLGLAATIGLFVILVAIGAPPITRLLLVIPAVLSASGYLQAYLKFCAGFGSIGIYNFGQRGEQVTVADPDSRRRDRVRSFQIGAAAFAIALAVALVALLLPI